MTQLIYPHIYLFAYHLTSGQSNLEDLDKPKFTTFPDGFYSKHCIGDSDTLLIACAVADKVTPPEKPCLDILKDKLLAKKQELSFSASLGKTWLITGYLPRFSYEVSPNIREKIKEQIAEEAYKDLGFESFPRNIQSGQFMGATVFEVSRSPKNWENLDTENHHVLIILYPDLKTMKRIDNFYEDLRYLLYYRNKIIWAYGNTRQIKPILEANFSPTDQGNGHIQILLPQAELLESNLKQLEQSLEKNYRDLAWYAENVAFLEVQKQTLKTNLYNFKQRLETIERKAEELAHNSTNLNIIKKFSEIVEYKYLAQVEQDYIALSPGLILRDKWIDTIRGIVEIRQAQLNEQKEERDRRLENRIAAVGVGVGVASTASSAFSALVKDFTRFYPVKVDSKKLPWGEPLSNLMVIILFSILFGVVSSWFTLWILDRRRVHDPKRRSRNRG
ncbi:hypothetical protein [Scytonema sp. NUACC26]|uniref:hypothetical protein n=1 Tax=Scytonema sp. NUACC26 TaxID=3140176 RepID=UPI0034DCA52D